MRPSKKLIFCLFGCMMCIFLSCSPFISDADVQMTPFEPALTEDQMVAILADIHVAESATQILAQPERDSLTEVYYVAIFQIADVDERDFQQSLKAYLAYPEKMEALYARVSVKVDDMVKPPNQKKEK